MNVENEVQPPADNNFPVEIIVNPETDDHLLHNNVEEEKRMKILCMYVKIYLPNFLFYSFVIFYMLAGAAYFYHHESAFQIESNNQKFNEFVEIRNNFYNKTRTLNDSNEEYFAEAQQELFKDLVSQIYHLKNIEYFTEKHLLNETIKNDEELIWSFSNSIFFATTILTTIGYTNKLSPETFYGKIGVILFAFFGIPILWAAVHNIAKFWYDIVSWGYERYHGWKTKVRKTYAMALKRIYINYFKNQKFTLFSTPAKMMFKRFLM